MLGPPAGIVVAAGVATNVLVGVLEVELLDEEDTELLEEEEDTELLEEEEDTELLEEEEDTELLEEEEVVRVDEELKLVVIAVFDLVFGGTIKLEEVVAEAELELELEDELELSLVLEGTARLDEKELELDCNGVLVLGGTAMLDELELELDCEVVLVLGGTMALEELEELDIALEVADLVSVRLLTVEVAELVVLTDVEEDDVTEVHSVLVKVVVLDWQERAKQFLFHQISPVLEGRKD